jgi:DNA-binding protein YbaB
MSTTEDAGQYTVEQATRVARLIVESKFTGIAADGLVSAVVRMTGEVIDVRVDEKFVEAYGIDSIGHSVVMAIRNAHREANKTTRSQLRAVGVDIDEITSFSDRAWSQ